MVNMGTMRHRQRVTRSERAPEALRKIAARRFEFWKTLRYPQKPAGQSFVPLSPASLGDRMAGSFLGQDSVVLHLLVCVCNFDIIFFLKDSWNFFLLLFSKIRYNFHLNNERTSWIESKYRKSINTCQKVTISIKHCFDTFAKIFATFYEKTFTPTYNTYPLDKPKAAIKRRRGRGRKGKREREEETREWIYICI